MLSIFCTTEQIEIENCFDEITQGFVIIVINIIILNFIIIFGCDLADRAYTGCVLSQLDEWTDNIEVNPNDIMSRVIYSIKWANHTLFTTTSLTLTIMIMIMIMIMVMVMIIIFCDIWW